MHDRDAIFLNRPAILRILVWIFAT